MSYHYEGDGYWITRDEEGRVWFEDNMARAELARVPNAPDYIKYDEFRGWIFKNGRELPWKND